MQTKIENLKNSELKMTVILIKEDLDFYVRKAEEKLAGEIKLDGFRTGKVSPKILREKVGEKAIKEEALDIAVKSSFVEAIQKEGIDLIETIEMKVLKNTPESLGYEVKMLVFPEVLLGEYKGIEIKKNLVSITDKEIEDALEYIQKSRAQFKKADSPAQKGNRVEINFEIKEKGKLIEGGKSEKHPFILGNGNFVPGFEDQIVGMKPGEKKHFPLVIPKDYYQKSIAGKRLDFDVEIIDVQHVMLPEVTDEFAKSLGNFSDVVTLRKNIGEGILTEKELRGKERIRLEILDKIIERSKIESPPLLIERQIDSMIKNFDENLHSKGLELGLYLAQIGKTQKDLRREWHSQADKQVKSMLMMREIAKRENITIGEDELLAATNEVLSVFRTIEEVEKKVDLQSLKEKIRNNILNEKILEFLEKNSKIKNPS